MTSEKFDTRQRCCDLMNDPRHPKGDPTYSRHCRACGIETRQAVVGNGYKCGLCAAKAFHANPPTEPPAPAPAPPPEVNVVQRYLKELRAPKPCSDMPDWMTGEGDAA